MDESRNPAPLDGPPVRRARLWLRPALLTIGGIAAALLLVAIDQVLAGVLLAALALLMGFWTSPLRRGRHVPLATALEMRSDERAIILWAPGDPLSARLQTAIRSGRPDVSWVNVLQDPMAQEFLRTSGGRGALPLVIVGSHVLRRATVGQLLDAMADGAERAAAQSESA
ncbi:DUF2254 domain-containing protein [Brachybacterium sp. JHP9]|uniref:DUF2254 domain-containing protein n=1 Tax=Brachybacterium equifaecis TaxID=2910770 RepID=A0ABT0R090_9MICO|nr:DUF2254 domain-containing protein [Brachybacterium equifaecis]